MGVLNSSQTNFLIALKRLAIISLLLSFFAWPFIRLTHLIFRFQKRDKQVAPGGF